MLSRLALGIVTIVVGAVGLAAVVHQLPWDEGGSFGAPGREESQRAGVSAADLDSTGLEFELRALRGNNPSGAGDTDDGSEVTITTPERMSVSSPEASDVAVGATTPPVPATTTPPVPATTTPPVPATTTPPVSATTTPPVPATTTPPASATRRPSGSFDAVVRPGESIQAVVDGLPEGSWILIGSGAHVRQQVKPKSGMVFVGESGAVLDGQNSTEYAFLAWSGEANNVTIRGLEVTRYVQANAPHGAIYVAHVSGWIVEDCEIHHNAFSGINVGSNSIVRNCFIHHNGRIGLKANGNNFLIEGNEISYNNPDDIADPLWEAGGIKFIESSGGSVIRNNYIHDNNGSGIWADVDANNTVIESNVVENNTHAGIDYEISSGGVIRNNTVRFNGHGHTGGWMWGAGITVRSPNVTVSGNVVQGNYAGIALIQTGRGSQYDVGGTNVRDNLIVNSGQNGGVRSGGASVIFDTSLFEENEYRYDNIDGDWWRWDDVVMSRTEWTAAGNDQNGVFGNP